MNAVTRLSFTVDPGMEAGPNRWQPAPWRAKWILAPGWDGRSPCVHAFRKRFRCAKRETLRVHVAADQRYDLWLDGERIGWGNERGVPDHWFYEGYELRLDPGPHVLAARVWWLDTADLTHLGHSTSRPGFLLHAVGPREAELDTAPGAWDAMALGGYSFPEPWTADQVVNAFVGVGSRTRLDAAACAWGWERGAGRGWAKAVASGEETNLRSMISEGFGHHRLAPAVLPAMWEKVHAPGRVRFARSFAAEPGAAFPTFLDEPVREADGDAALAAAWRGVHAAAPRAVRVPPRTVQRVLIDLGDYHCGWPQLRVSGGAGSEVRIGWAEALALKPKGSWEKGNRDEIDGKFFAGYHDDFLPDGGRGRVFEPMWFEAGRYVQVTVRTADAPLAVESLALRETHYPIRWAFSFRSDDRRWASAIRPMKRTLEMCSHESYFDCPYYEQLMYGGDSRLEILATYATTRDDRLPRKAMLLFDRSRASTGGGLTLSRVPSRRLQVIPAYSLHWAMMVSDYSLWRDDPAFVRDRLDGIRAVLLAFRRDVGEDGLLRSPVGWNFTDWVPGWPAGEPAGAAAGGINATLNLHYAWTLRLAADLEERFGEPAFAAWDRALARRIGEACVRAFWDKKRSLFAETPAHDVWTEHAQCMAVCGGFVPKGREAALGEALATAPDLARATVYYSFYLMEAFRILGRAEDLHGRFGLWFGLEANGQRTVPEMPEPTRSDCHAWGSHPLYHLLASIAGVRPAAPGFAAVRIEPMPGPLGRIEARVPHPKGEVRVDLRRGADGAWRGEVSVPKGVPATFAFGGRETAFKGTLRV